MNEEPERAPQPPGKPAEAPPPPVAPKYPNGAIQGVCTGAIGMLALLIAFIGYTNYTGSGSTAGWERWHQIYLWPALLAAGALALVPWLATERDVEINGGSSLQRARRCFLIGAIAAVGSMATFVTLDFLRSRHEANAIEEVRQNVSALQTDVGSLIDQAAVNKKKGDESEKVLELIAKRMTALEKDASDKQAAKTK